ncbi:MAG: hypothetical protein QGF59_04075, partial [Pirellulaceae bacterium]|nr:hypothetical protein [Pirellulaceae bacterium]
MIQRTGTRTFKCDKSFLLVLALCVLGVVWAVPGQRAHANEDKADLNRIKQLAHDAEQARARLADAKAKARGLGSKLIKAGFTPTSFDSTMSLLVTRRMECELDLYGKQARIEAIEMILSNLSKSAGKKVSSEETQLMIAEERALLKAKLAELARLRELAKSKPEIERAEAEIELVQI